MKSIMKLAERDAGHAALTAPRHQQHQFHSILFFRMERIDGIGLLRRMAHGWEGLICLLLSARGAGYGLVGQPMLRTRERTATNHPNQ